MSWRIAFDLGLIEDRALELLVEEIVPEALRLAPTFAGALAHVLGIEREARTETPPSSITGFDLEVGSLPLDELAIAAARLTSTGAAFLELGDPGAARFCLGVREVLGGEIARRRRASQLN